ncbi:MAG TPA: GDP-mannose 4,6-dehydratase [bacterium]
MPDRVVVTGATGFVGGHLIEFLLKHTKAQVYAAKRRRSEPSPMETRFNGRVQWVEMDVTDAHNVLSTVRSIRPTHIFHLAAQSFVPTSWQSPSETLMINAIGTVNVLEAVKSLDLDTRIQIAGSSEEYGYVRPDELPITEQNPLRPLSPYGVSKVAADLSGQQYHRSFGLHVITTRAFNHTGPGRGEVFVESNFSRQIAAIEHGSQKPVIRVGNLDATRDFSDVRDIVRAYWLALERGTPGEVYNICSGKALRIRDLLETLLNLSVIKSIQVKPDPARMRPSDVQALRGDCTKFQRDTGWKPEVSLERTWQDLLNYWRDRVKQERVAHAAP